MLTTWPHCAQESKQEFLPPKNVKILLLGIPFFSSSRFTFARGKRKKKFVFVLFNCFVSFSLGRLFPGLTMCFPFRKLSQHKQMSFSFDWSDVLNKERKDSTKEQHFGLDKSDSHASTTSSQKKKKSNSYQSDESSLQNKTNVTSRKQNVISTKQNVIAAKRVLSDVISQDLEAELVASERALKKVICLFVSFLICEFLFCFFCFR